MIYRTLPRKKHTGKSHQSVEPGLPKVAILISRTCATNIMRRLGDRMVMMSNIDYSMTDKEKEH